MNRFFVLEIGWLTQYRYAWCDPYWRKPEDYRTSDDCPQCPVCKRAIGMRRWLPPHQVEIKQPRNVGDFLFGEFSFVGSERFKTAYESSGLVGIERFHPLEVVRMGTTKREKSYPKPILFGADVVHSNVRIDYEKGKVEWTDSPESDYCRFCGPGGGGKGGNFGRLFGAFVEENTWQGQDFFYAINLSGTVLLSERAADFIRGGEFTNANVIPAEQLRISFVYS